MPPIAGLQDICPSVSMAWVSRSVRAPVRADASAASVPAWPPPTTITSNRSGKSMVGKGKAPAGKSRGAMARFYGKGPAKAGFVPRGTPNPRPVRCSTWNLLADAEAGKDGSEEVVRAHLAGDAPQGRLRQAQLFCIQFIGLRVTCSTLQGFA